MTECFFDAPCISSNNFEKKHQIRAKLRPCCASTLCQIFVILVNFVLFYFFYLLVFLVIFFPLNCVTFVLFCHYLCFLFVVLLSYVIFVLFLFARAFLQISVQQFRSASHSLTQLTTPEQDLVDIIFDNILVENFYGTLYGTRISMYMEIGNLEIVIWNKRSS